MKLLADIAAAMVIYGVFAALLLMLVLLFIHVGRTVSVWWGVGPPVGFAIFVLATWWRGRREDEE